jgi:hypothetical protein
VDLEILKKKVSTFRGEGGRVTKVSDELLMEILSAWEQWTGPASGFYKALGISQKGISSIIGKAKKLKRDGHFPVDDFKEIKIEGSPSNLTSLQSGPCMGVEILWDNGKLIRFQLVEQLVDFLKKVA